MRWHCVTPQGPVIYLFWNPVTQHTWNIQSVSLWVGHATYSTRIVKRFLYDYCCTHNLVYMTPFPNKEHLSNLYICVCILTYLFYFVSISKTPSEVGGIGISSRWICWRYENVGEFVTFLFLATNLVLEKLFMKWSWGQIRKNKSFPTRLLESLGKWRKFSEIWPFLKSDWEIELQKVVWNLVLLLLQWHCRVRTSAFEGLPRPCASTYSSLRQLASEGAQDVRRPLTYDAW